MFFNESISTQYFVYWTVLPVEEFNFKENSINIFKYLYHTQYNSQCLKRNFDIIEITWVKHTQG